MQFGLPPVEEENDEGSLRLIVICKIYKSSKKRKMRREKKLRGISKRDQRKRSNMESRFPGNVQNGVEAQTV